jgi:hypothetical protein
MFNEPGAVSYRNGTSNVELTGTFVNCGSQTIDVLAGGYVLVIATAQPWFAHTNGTVSSFVFGVSDSESSLPDNQDINLILPAALESGNYYLPLTAHGLFRAASPGTYTYYFLGRELSGDCIVSDIQFTCIYISTTYGTVNPTVSGAPGPADNEAPRAQAIDVAAQREASLAANNDRIQREIEALRADIEMMKQRMKND